ncbi:phosphodiester glycosidase family protein [Mariniphaga sediminis]|uniref:Phosphodiester glycosidase family protein n=1 Tax=Mariniphaga sediminis TaxID=1628158 RepID=A0A399DBE1_9BACT|nr:phosphodiester glycosidase family protein [Mariniphaga sediminis]RIH67180.1 phosphodiester glycosidase family protein [Mariniphaga sediminis]
MKVLFRNVLLFSALFFSFQCLGNPFSQQEDSLKNFSENQPDVEKIARIDWNETFIRDGIILKSAKVELFESQQAIFFVEIDTSIAALNYFVGMPADKLLPTSTQAKEKDALIAINGSYFNMKEGPSRHFVKIENKVVAETAQSEFETRATGLFSVTHNRADIGEWSSETEMELAGNAAFALVAGPIVIDDNKKMEMWDSPFVNKRHPRSFVAFSKGKLLLGVVDGRDPGRAEGMNLHELRILARGLGCSDLLNLDGGGSSTLYVKGVSGTGIINVPSDGQERPVKSIIYLTQQ